MTEERTNAHVAADIHAAVKALSHLLAEAEGKGLRVHINLPPEFNYVSRVQVGDITAEIWGKL